MKILAVLISVLLIVLIVKLAMVAEQMHTDGFNRCNAAGGFWLDREMKCIKATEIKV